MVDSLNVVALISGGKDSLYSLLHCMQNGHKVVALANLYPLESADKDELNEEQSEEDINSFMYQTVGHSVIPLYADALQLPLYRRQITGSAVQTSRDYAYSYTTDSKLSSSTSTSSEEQDETEDLMPLLQNVLQNHPEINAINTGAIQSTYQRTRIESIALRLGLTPLAYLWQYPVLPPPFNPETETVMREDTITSLLDDMAAVGCESRIIKIASGGIRESLLWSDVTSARTRTQLVAGLRKFFDDDELGLRGAVVGEGGEFETLALNGPKILWKGGRITIDERAIRTVNDEGGASYIKIGAASVVAYTDDQISVRSEKEAEGQVRVPAMLDKQFAAIQMRIDGSRDVSNRVSSSPVPSSPSDTQEDLSSISIPIMQPVIGPSSVQIANITHLSQSQSSSPKLAATAKAQMQSIATLIPKILLEVSTVNKINPALTSSTIVSTMLLLKDMSAFASINPIYATIFHKGVPIPPARVTIAAALPEGIEVMMSITLDRSSRQHRRGLHVQGRSYWAPANIGPYSQAVAVPYEKVSQDDHVQTFFEIVHVAGQIPLVPASMDLLGAGFADQAILSLQHLWRLGQERRVDYWTVGVAFLPIVKSHDSIDNRVVAAGKIWKEAHMTPALTDRRSDSNDEEEDFDIWHVRNNRTTTEHESSSGHDGQHLRHLPSHKLRFTTNPSDVLLPAFIAAEVSALPRNASVEWWSTGLTGLDSAQQGQVTWRQSAEYGRITLSSTRSECTDTSLVTCLVPNSSGKEDGLDVSYIASLIDQVLKEAKQKAHTEVVVTGTAIVLSTVTEAWCHFVQERTARHTQENTKESGPDVSSYLRGLSIIPCHRLWGYKEVSISHETRNDIQVHSEQLTIALILRVDAQSS